MSIKVDPDQIRQWKVSPEKRLSEVEDKLSKPGIDKEMVIGLAALEAKRLGLFEIALGNYGKAKKDFSLAIHYQDKLIDILEQKEGFNPKASWSNFYAEMLTYLEMAILTQDKEVIEKAARKFDLSTPVNEWDRRSRPYYCLIKAYASLILDDKEELQRVKEQSKNMRREAGIDSSLEVIWAITESDIATLKEVFKRVTSSVGHSERRTFEGIVSTRLMVLLILANIRNIDLSGFDPPMVDMNYVKQSTVS